MARLSALAFTELSLEQQEVLGGIPSAKRAVLAGPNSVLIRLPDVCASVRDLSIRLRNQSRIEDRLFEVMVLTVAQAWTAQYEWFAHEPGARKAGIPDAVVEAIRGGADAPPFERDDERVVYALVYELQTTKRVGDATYAQARDLLGEDKLIELVAAVGFYNLIAVVLNAFDVPVPDDQPPPL